MILSIAAGMWPTAVAAIVVSLLPAALAFRRSRRVSALPAVGHGRGRRRSHAGPCARKPHRCESKDSRTFRPSGAVLLAARHFHHLLDGAVLVRYVPRPVHIVVGLDWTANDAGTRVDGTGVPGRAVSDRACGRRRSANARGYARNELVQYTRAALRDAAALLTRGPRRARFSRRLSERRPGVFAQNRRRCVLPFARGYERMIARGKQPACRVAVVPVGFHYTRGQSGRSSRASAGARRYVAMVATSYGISAPPCRGASFDKLRMTARTLRCHPELVEGRHRMRPITNGPPHLSK